MIAYLDFLILGLFLAALIFLGMRQKVADEASYLVAGRRTGLFSLTATLVMTEFNTTTLLSFAAIGYSVGYLALVLPLIFLVGLIFYAVSVAKKWKEFDGLSVASFFKAKYGSDIAMLASISLLLAMAGFSSTYVKSLYLLFIPLFPGCSQWSLSALLVGVSLLMTLRGGLLSVIKTDTVCFLLTLLFFPLMAFLAWKGAPVETDYSWQEAKVMLPPRFVISLIILTMFTYILAPWYGQKIFSAGSKKIACQGVLLSAILIFILYFLCVLSACFARNYIISSPEGALGQMTLQLFPLGLRGLGLGILFAASATTLTGVWSAASAMIVGDFFFIKEQKSSKSYRGALLTIGFAAIPRSPD